MTDVSSYLDSLNNEQKKAVLHEQGPAIVLAGAGSGKTKVLTTRVAYLLQEKKVMPHEVMLVTFTNKAAGEMNKRVLELTGQQLQFSGTFHSLCAKILRSHATEATRDTSFTIYDSNDQLSLIKQIYKDKNFDTKKYKPQFIKSLISQAKNEMLLPDEYQALAQDTTQEFAAKIYRLYQMALQKLNAFDFDDLLLETVRIFQKNKPILEVYQNQIHHVLVDEYQDTNKAQYFLTEFFAHPHDNLYVVGDFSQSIYAWRGADYRNLLRLNQDFPSLKEYRLEQNYRSTQTILDAATQVISHNTSHPVLGLWTEKSLSEPISILETADEEDEAEKVAQRIRQEVSFSYSDFAILYRTNAQSRAFEETFVRHGIPYRIVGGVRFYDRKEIKDILAYVRVLLNPNDSVNFKRAEKSGKRRLQSLLRWKEEDPDILTDITPFELIEKVLTVTGYKDTLNSKDPQDASRLENIDELLNTASQFSDMVLFLENIALVQDGYFHDVEKNQKGDGVTLMSLHSAKGLEFPVVFMVGMEEGLLPHQQALWNKDQMEEERRLCYVGITRAREKLFFSYARKRWSFNQAIYTTRSRFLSDISPNLIKEIGTLPPQRHTFPPSSFSSGRPFSSHGEGTASSRFSHSRQNQTFPSHQPTKRVVIDDDTLDALLDGEIDARKFLDS